MALVRLGSLAAMISGVLFLAGCGSSASSESASATESPTAAEAASPAASGAVTTLKPTTPTAATFVGEEMRDSRFPDSPKIEVRYGVKVYSDGNFLFHGPYTEFWSDGGKALEGQYADDVKVGTWKYYHPNGRLAREVKYVDGQPDGSWTRYSDDGAKEADASYKNGKRHGEWRYYQKVAATSDPADKSKSQESSATKPADAAKSAAPKPADAAKPADSPREAASDVPPPVWLSLSETYVDGQRSGVATTFYPSGQKQSETHFVADKRHGLETRWFESGKKFSEANYKDNLADGMVTVWNEKGEIVVQQEYQAGKLVRKTAKANAQASK